MFLRQSNDLEKQGSDLEKHLRQSIDLQKQGSDFKK